MRKCAKCKKLKSNKDFYKYYYKKNKINYYRSYCKTCIKLINKKQYNKNKNWHKNYYIKNKNKIIICNHKFSNIRRKGWYKWLKKEYGHPVICEICETKLYFGHKNKRMVPHFDHRRGKFEIIKFTPSSMFKLKMNKERQNIFKSCNFGILCDNCNKGLPTDLKKRKLMIKNLIKYILRRK